MRSAVIALVSTIVIASCTAGLGEAQTERCSPAARQADDVCNRLNEGQNTCLPWQCDAASSHCAQRPRDDDRDGDPSIACGGHDCDDTTAAVSSHAVEICDGRDNNCDGLVDEGHYDGDLPVPLSSEVGGPLGSTSEARVTVGDTTEDAIGAFRKIRSDATACLGVIGNTGSHDRCALGDPHEPSGCRIGSVLGLAYVDESDTTAQCLRYAPSDGTIANGACARLPTLTTLDGESALVFGYQGNDAPDACGATRALVFARVAGAAGSAPQFEAPVTIAPTTRAAAPPATTLVATANGPRILVAASGADSVGLWSVGADSQVTAAGTTAIAGARAVSVAVGVSGTGFRVALAVENGCGASPSTVELWLGEVSSALERITTPFHRVAAGIAATRPSVAWSTASSEWRLGWIEDGGVARGQRFTTNGAPIGAPFFIAANVVDASFDRSSTLVVLDTTDLSVVSLRCH